MKEEAEEAEEEEQHAAPADGHSRSVPNSVYALRARRLWCLRRRCVASTTLCLMSSLRSCAATAWSRLSGWPFWAQGAYDPIPSKMYDLADVGPVTVVVMEASLDEGICIVCWKFKGCDVSASRVPHMAFDIKNGFNCGTSDLHCAVVRKVCSDRARDGNRGA